MFVCLFFQGSKTAECGSCDVYDSCVLCAVGCIFPLMAAWEPFFEVCTPDVTLIEGLSDNYHSVSNEFTENLLCILKTL